MSLTSADLQAIAKERYGVSGTVWHVAPPTPPVYANSTTYSIGQQVLSASYSGGAHVYECVVGGASRSSGNPTWHTDGSQVFDTGSSGLKWQDMGVCPVPGNDSSDGLSWGTAFATASHALSVVTAGDRVQLAAGDFNGVYGLTVPVGVTVAGAGMEKTRIRNVSYIVFTLRSNTTLEDLSILFAPISFTGVNVSYGVPIDIGYAEGTIHVRRIFCGIAQDSIIVHKQLVPRTLRLVVEDCVLWSCFDNYNVFADPAVGDVLHIDSYRCTFYANGQNLSGVTPRNLALGQSGGNVTARFYDCKIRSENGNIAGSSFVTGMIVYGGAKVEIYGGAIDVANAGTNQLSAIDNTGQGTTGGTVSTIGCAFDRSKVVGVIADVRPDVIASDALAVNVTQFNGTTLDNLNPLPANAVEINGNNLIEPLLGLSSLAGTLSNFLQHWLLTPTGQAMGLGFDPTTGAAGIRIAGQPTYSGHDFNGDYLLVAINSDSLPIFVRSDDWRYYIANDEGNPRLHGPDGVFINSEGAWVDNYTSGGVTIVAQALPTVPSQALLPFQPQTEVVGGVTRLTSAALAESSGTINPQDVRDAMKLAPSAGAAAAGSIDALVNLDSISVVPPGAATGWTNWTYRQLMVMLGRLFFAGAKEDGSTRTLYADDGSTVITTQTVGDDGSTQTQGRVP